MKHTYLYLRVSTQKQAVQGESLEVQEAVCRHYAQQHDLHITAVFREPYSGRKNYRPELDRMFREIEENPHQVQAVVIRDIDRFTRGGAVFYQALKQRLNDASIELIDTGGIIQPTRNTLGDLGFEYDWSLVSPSRTSETLAAETANEEVSRILTRTISQEIRLAQHGFWVRPAPIGFQNTKIEHRDGKKKPILEAHPEEAPWIQRIFTLRAEGLLTDKAICDQLNALGFRSRSRKKRDPMTGSIIGTTGGTRLTPQLLNRIVRRLAYCGINREKWTNNLPVKLAFPGLVSIETFNQANRGEIEITEDRAGNPIISHGKAPKRRQAENPIYPFRFVVRCPKCTKPFKGSASRGKLGKRYPGYHCSRDHPYFRVPVATLHEAVHEYVETLSLRTEVIDLLQAVALDTWRRKQTESADIEQQAQMAVGDLESKQQQLLEQLIQTESPTVRRLLEQQIEAIDQEIEAGAAIKESVNPTPNKFEAYFDRVRSLVEHPAELLLHAENQQRLQRVWGFVFEALPTYQDLVGGTPKLSVVFEAGKVAPGDENGLVALLSTQWNIFVKQVRKGHNLPKHYFQVP